MYFLINLTCLPTSLLNIRPFIWSVNLDIGLIKIRKCLVSFLNSIIKNKLGFTWEISSSIRSAAESGVPSATLHPRWSTHRLYLHPNLRFSRSLHHGEARLGHESKVHNSEGPYSHSDFRFSSFFWGPLPPENRTFRHPNLSTKDLRNLLMFLLFFFCLDTVLNILYQGLQSKAIASISAESLQEVCSSCQKKMAQHFTMLLQVSESVIGSDLWPVAKLSIYSNRSCYANLQLSRTIKTIVYLHSMTCCYA